MRKIVCIFATVIVVWGLIAAPAVADWMSDGTHKMHNPQLPDVEGWDVKATYPVFLADDWMCSESGPVSEIHFWGSWRWDDWGTITGFHLSIHADIPDPNLEDPLTYSRPANPPLWEYYTEEFIVNTTPEWTAGVEGWYDPSTELWVDPDHENYHQINIFIPELDWFFQDEGRIYWLNISAEVPGSNEWGWKTTLDRWNDDAVWSLAPAYNWIHMDEPPSYSYIPGDVNSDGVVDNNDVTYLQGFLYGGPAPPYSVPGPFYPSADANGDCAVGLTDLTYLTAYVNGTGPAPTYCPAYPPVGYGQTLDLAFVISGPTVEPTGACCYDPTGGSSHAACIITTATDCGQTYGGTYMGDGTTCGSVQACCFADGTCMDADSLCCLNALGGTPQGTGTNCSGTTIACCLPGGGCADVDPLCCDEMGGTPSSWSGVCLGDGDFNTIDDACEPPALEACCLPDGTCQDMDAMACINAGGRPQGAGTACSGITVACCLPDGTCQDVDPLCCDEMGGIASPSGVSACLGDLDLNGTDDACEGPGWYPGQPHKMHFPQLPDEVGWDVNATVPSILADDWMCTETGWVKDLHFWGSWRHDVEGFVDSFTISFHTDIPADPTQGMHSMPGTTLDDFNVSEFVIVPIDPPSSEGWYDPLTGEVFPNDNTHYFQYNIYLPEQHWLMQDSGTIYWVNISAHVSDPQMTHWGWKSSFNHWNDDAVWAQWGNLSWTEMYEPSIPITNHFDLTIDPQGNFVSGSGENAFNDEWYHYDSDWWNVWFYDHPFDSTRIKPIYLEINTNFMDPGQSGYIEIAINWSTDLWSLEGNPPGDRYPPPTDVDEGLYIGRRIIYAGDVYPELFQIYDTLWEYNPEWVSVDVRGENFVVYGSISHDCVSSLDLSFVITGEPDVTEPTGACCYSPVPGPGLNETCIVTTADSCANHYLGTYYGDDTDCGSWQACCYGVGVYNCTMADSICCVNELGGTPQGTGSTCGGMQACCTSTGACVMADSLCCVDLLGGTPQGAGTTCGLVTIACCLPGGGCVDVDPLCCDDMGGIPSPTGAPACLGDANADGVNDACEVPFELKWEQRPDLDPTGMDVYGTYYPTFESILLADDFFCTDSGPITEIHVWASWYQDELPFDGPGSIPFTLSIHADVPAGVDQSYSHPGDLLWMRYSFPGQYEFRPYATDIDEGFFWPHDQGPGAYVFPGDHVCWEYIFTFDPEDQFIQLGTTTDPIIYWLDIQPSMEGQQVDAYWGWKTTPIAFNWNDDAVWQWGDEPGDPANWQELIYPDLHPNHPLSVNLAFAIYGDVTDTCDEQFPGDVDNNGTIGSTDIVYLVNYLYKGGSAPPVLANADPNGDCWIDEGDIEYLIAYIFDEGPDPVDCTCVNPQPCDCFIADANNDGALNVGDAVYLINYVFKSGPAPIPYPLCNGDANYDCTINVGDAVYMINYVFKNGPRPYYCHQWIQPPPAGCGGPLRD
ncbi:MAG: hypothetical protein GY841_18420 [FCB group bacterium]|nr:hypothetical protein [FCB group bacterium]